LTVTSRKPVTVVDRFAPIHRPRALPTNTRTGWIDIMVSLSIMRNENVRSPLHWTVLGSK